MRSLRTRFAIIVGVFALAFSSFILYRAWTRTRVQVEEAALREGALALEFDLAIRQYIAEKVRPEVERLAGKDAFIPEIMSTSFVARSIFEKVQAVAPDHVLKFSTDAPRNPANQAGPEELEKLEYFRQHPEVSRWSGKLTLNGEDYLAQLSPMRVEESCLRCHGRPEDAPAGLIERYGSTVGFHRAVGEVVALDTVAIPLKRVDEAIFAERRKQLVMLAVGLLVLFAAVLVVFDYIVAGPLDALGIHFRRVAERAETAPVAPVPVQRRDEIGALAASFNALAARLRAFHASLEQRVAERTSALRSEVAQHQRTEAALQKERNLLKELLDVQERERRLVAYDIHDGLTQEIAGAMLHFQSLPRPPVGQGGDTFDAGLRLLRQSMAEARRLINNLRPPILDESGVVAAIEHLACEIEESGGPRVEFMYDSEFARLVAPLETTLFRIAQEALRNAWQHGKADRVRITLAAANSRVRLEVEDWGAGFDPQQVEAGRFGLEGIRQRASHFGGQAAIHSTPGKGTRISVDLPLVKAPEDETPENLKL